MIARAHNTYYVVLVIDSVLIGGIVVITHYRLSSITVCTFNYIIDKNSYGSFHKSI